MNRTIESQFFVGEHLEKLQSIMHPSRAEAGAYLFWEGDELGKLYFIKSGRIKLIKTTEDGKNIILSIAKEGDLIGDLGAVGNAFYSYSAEVIDDADIGVIEQPDLETLLSQHGDFAVHFMKWLGTVNMKSQTKFRDLLLFGKPGAVASTLIRMSNTYGSPCEDGIHLDVRVNNTELAEMIGATRESVNRLLGTLRDEGTISMRNGHIVIHHIDKLRTICNCPTYPVCPVEVCRL